MKLLDGIVITEIGNKKVAICTGEAADVFKGFIDLNETAYEIWKGLEKEMNAEEIAFELIKEYPELEYNEAIQHVNSFIDKLKAKGLVTD